MNINEFHTDIVFHPGETLSEKLEELKLSPKEFATFTEISEETIMSILKGEASVTPEMAVLFEKILKIPASFWIKRQSNYNKYKTKEIIKKKKKKNK